MLNTLKMLKEKSHITAWFYLSPIPTVAVMTTIVWASNKSVGGQHVV